MASSVKESPRRDSLKESPKRRQVLSPAHGHEANRRGSELSVDWSAVEWIFKSMISSQFFAPIYRSLTFYNDQMLVEFEFTNTACQFEFHYLSKIVNLQSFILQLINNFVWKIWSSRWASDMSVHLLMLSRGLAVVSLSNYVMLRWFTCDCICRFRNR